jgi:hypothetical protein
MQYYFGAGDFTFYSGKPEERYLTHDFKIVDSMDGAWDILKVADNLLECPILPALQKTCWQDHTDKTFMASMLEMRAIAKLGWDTYANCILPEFW